MAVKYRNNLPKAIAVLKPAAGRGVMKTAEAGRDIAKGIVRVDSGKLQSEIKAERVDDQTAQIIVYGAEVPYNFAQEFGFSPEQLERLGMQSYAHDPYMRPAAEGIRLDLAPNVASEIREALT